MEQEREIDLLEVWQIILKRKWTIIYITLFSVIIAAMVSFFFIKPVYQAKVSVIIGKEAAKVFYEDRYTSSDITMYQNLVKTYSEIAKSNSVLKKTQEGIKEYSTNDISNLITVTPKTNTQILELIVKGDTPSITANVAKELVKNFILESRRVLPAGDIEILDEPETPSAPISPNRKRNVSIAFFLGLMVSTGLVILLEFIDQTVRTEEDIKDCLDMPILISIPKR